MGSRGFAGGISFLGTIPEPEDVQQKLIRVIGSCMNNKQLRVASSMLQVAYNRRFISLCSLRLLQSQCSVRRMELYPLRAVKLDQKKELEA